MRAILATAIYCLFTFSTAGGHTSHHRTVPAAAGMLGPGLAHMLESMGKPQAWCGWYMRKLEHVADSSYNRAANWAHFGEPAFDPAPGIIVVWPHHVGVIRGGPDRTGDWLVESGNDGHAVRTRFRSLRGAIALRYAESRR
jgi:hypothetical protein